MKSKCHNFGDEVKMLQMLMNGGSHFHTRDILKLLDEAFEKVFLDRWSHVVKNDKEINKGLFSCDNFLLHVHI